MARSHNKKRNVGIIYELLLRSIAASLIEGDKERASAGLRIIENRFDKSTEIYKEFRIFNALAMSTISSTPAAAGILAEAKSAIRRADSDRLDSEKSGLIRDVNHYLCDDNFYYRKIPNYRVYGTIQNLFNEWRKRDSASFKKIIACEGKVVEWLISEKAEQKDILDHESPDVDSLVVKIMTDRINEKYSINLNTEQKDIISTYSFSLVSDDKSIIREKLENIKADSINELCSFSAHTDNNVLLEKIELVREKISRLLFEKIDDSVITKCLTLSQMKSQIRDDMNV
tara:strand:+ start:40583 stop:41440 length:858 start_codon:yes stop_codon:yes gene_type:complete